MEIPIYEAPDKRRLWLSCREKSCCTQRTVVLNGRDMWRISTAMELDPWAFSAPSEVPIKAPAAFRLDHGGGYYMALLVKKGGVVPNGAPCLFLWRSPDGHAQCGLDALRPLSCMRYPLAGSSHSTSIDASACTCEQWKGLNSTESSEIQARTSAEHGEWNAVVDRWNRSLTGGEVGAGYQNFCRYVLEEYNMLYGATGA